MILVTLSDKRFYICLGIKRSCDFLCKILWPEGNVYMIYIRMYRLTAIIYIYICLLAQAKI
jgi:hypothetical protein